MPRPAASKRGGARPGAGRSAKPDPGRSRSVRFTRAQEALIVEWQTKRCLPDFSAALHDLVARGLGET